MPICYYAERVVHEDPHSQVAETSPDRPVPVAGLIGGVTEAGIYVYGIREFGARTEPDRRI